jgi:hypothetical protein
MAKKGKYRTFLISMPSELIPIYDFVQRKLNQFLSDSVFRSKLLALDFSKHRGNVWRDIRDIAGKGELASWKGEIPNPVWYFYMLCDNLLRIVKSKDNAIVCFNALKNNGNKIDQDLFELLNDQGIYPTVGFLRNLKRSDEPPTIAKKATFVMDYSVSAEQNCQRIADNIFGFNYESGKYLTYEVVIPLSMRKNLTGRIAKPRFIKRKSDGRYVGHCSYHVDIPTVKGQNILGVDLGKKKLFSSVVLYSDGDYSDEIINSRLSRRIDEKLKRKLKDLERLLAKNKTLEDLINRDINLFNSHLEEIRQNRMNQIMELRGNISHTKRYIAKLIASEVVSIAKENDCKEIHVENLSWLESNGGRWNHSEIQDFITEFAELEGIKVVKIYAKHTSSAHPITGELGKKRNRNIQFQNGDVIDRDLLASINIAKRNEKNQKDNNVNQLKKRHTSTPKKVKKPSNRKVSLAIKNKLLTNQRGTEIVVLYPRKTGNRTWEVLDVSSKPHKLSLMSHLSRQCRFVT